MAKNDAKNDPKRTKNTEEYITTKGLHVRLSAMPSFLASRLRKSVPVPDKPTYEVKTVAGEVESFFHDETTLLTEEDKKAWDAYKNDVSSSESQLTLKFLKAVLAESVEIIGEYETLFLEWVQMQEYMEISLPSSRDIQVMMFKEDYVYASSDDLEYIVNKVMFLTGLSSEDIAEKQDSF